MTDKHSNLPPDRLLQPTTVRWFVTVLGISLLYAIVRYHLVGDVSWDHFPLYIFNKATSLAAVIFIASSYLIGKVIHWHDNDKSLRLVVIKFCGLIGFFMAGIHAFLSLALLSPAYFAKYFSPNGMLNFQGEAGMTIGVIALFFLLMPAITTIPMMPKAIGGQRWKRNQRAGYAALFLILIHLTVLGIFGWLEPGGWNGGMPPISLVAAVAALVPLLVKRRLVHEKQQRDEQRSEKGNNS